MIAIIDGVGCNINSVKYALDRLGRDAVLTKDPEIIKRASHVILPGVGSAGRGMQSLQAMGLVPVIKQLRQPVLGICLGMQLLFNRSLEDDVNCLGILEGDVTPFAKRLLPLPHMGWNQLQWSQSSALSVAVPDGSYCYFVHSFKVPVNTTTQATANYIENFAAIVQHDNFYGMQFHPERSGTVGQRLLKNFLNEGSCYADLSSH